MSKAMTINSSNSTWESSFERTVAKPLHSLIPLRLCLHSVQYETYRLMQMWLISRSVICYEWLLDPRKGRYRVDFANPVTVSGGKASCAADILSCSVSSDAEACVPASSVSCLAGFRFTRSQRVRLPAVKKGMGKDAKDMAKINLIGHNGQRRSKKSS